MSARAWNLCPNPIGINECTRCLRNPEHPSNAKARNAINQQWRKPMATDTACGDFKQEGSR